jgi:hypothetical protein
MTETVGTEQPGGFLEEFVKDMTSPRFDLDDVVDDALLESREMVRVERKVPGQVVIDSGRRFSDGEPVLVRVWLPTSSNTTIAVGDGCLTFARLAGMTATPDYAMAVREELLEHLPVRYVGGQIILTTHISRTHEAIATMADSCLAIDVAVIVANHLRPKNEVA